MLAIAEKKIIPKLYLFTEHLKSKSYEKKLKNADGILSISQKIMNTLMKLATVII